MFTRSLFVVLLGICLSLVNGYAVPTAPSVEDEEVSANAPGKRDSRCPSRNGAMPVFLPHETRCSQYYVCDTGLAIPLVCPHHLLFNVDKNVCDHPEMVDCNNGASDNEQRTYRRDAVSSAPVAKRDSRCPTTNGAQPIYLSHESDCSKFYICDSGFAFLKTCAFNLHQQFFNAKINACDHPYNVLGCANGKKIDDEVIDSRVVTTKSCPRINGKFPVFLPHDVDCGKYYVCDWGRAIMMHCPPNMSFDPELDTCSNSRLC